MQKNRYLKFFCLRRPDGPKTLDDLVVVPDGFGSNADVEEIEEIDEHTTASLQVNELTQKVKIMTAELAKRKKIIEEKDLIIGQLKGHLTSNAKEYEFEKKSWESRLERTISDFKCKLRKYETE